LRFFDSRFCALTLLAASLWCLGIRPATKSAPWRRHSYISRLLLAINGAENNKFWSASALKSLFSLFAHDFKDDVVKLIFKKY
jgi:hypothetical protein